VTGVAERAAVGPTGPDQLTWSRLLASEHDNVRAALDPTAAECDYARRGHNSLWFPRHADPCLPEKGLTLRRLLQRARASSTQQMVSAQSARLWQVFPRLVVKRVVTSRQKSPPASTCLPSVFLVLGRASAALIEKPSPCDRLENLLGRDGRHGVLSSTQNECHGSDGTRVISSGRARPPLSRQASPCRNAYAVASARLRAPILW
jgi:hypothetical protein